MGKGNFNIRDIFSVFFCFVVHARNLAQLLPNTRKNMAKSTKKASPKATKKAAPKASAKKSAKAAKPARTAAKASKPAKKSTPKKVVKPAKPASKVVAKKAQPAKAVKPVAKPAVKAKESVKVEKPITVKGSSSSNSSTPPKSPAPSLNVFPGVSQQRPIAHRPAGNATAANTDTRTRYSDEELKEFEELINQKLDKAKGEYKILKETLNRNNDEGTDATSGGNTKVLEDGAETAEKENMSQLAARQQKYIMNLENALIRIKNGTYGICTVTGKLISKERLYAVPHTTQSIEAKMLQQD